MSFILCLLVIELLLYAYRNIAHPDRAVIQRRLMRSTAEADSEPGYQLLKDQSLSGVPYIHRILAMLPGIARMQMAIKQANVSHNLSFFILLSLSLGITAYFICSFLAENILIAIPAAIVSSAVPWFYVQTKLKKRMAKFEKQLPEALGLIARALKAGHAFTSGMKLASDEFSDPLGTYFKETMDEINFGISVADALKNMAARAACPDLKFFTVSVILQRETGGNLAEIIEGLAHLIRERFKFRGKVQTFTAEARISAKILITIPFVLFGLLYMANPEYAGILIHDPAGKIMAGTGICLIVVAWFVIKRLISIDV